MLVNPAISMDAAITEKIAAKAHRTSFGLCKQVGAIPLIFELDLISSNYNLCASILGKFETAETFPSGNY